MSTLDGVTVTSQDLDAALLNLDDSGGLIGKALRHGDYFNTVSYNDAVYRIFKLLKEKPVLIPEYNQIVVDEYQDFSLLEVSLLQLLAEKSPILIAGDDDQALYSFRHASSQYIRSLATDESFSRFELPYCTRCTDVIVQSTRRVIEKASASGLLEGRIDKPYQCYLPSKRAVSEAHPKITHAECTMQTNPVPIMSKYVKKCIDEISQEDIEESHRGKFPTALIVGPPHFARMIAKYVQEYYPQLKLKAGQKLQVELVDAYRFLRGDPNSRIGWRIVAELFPPKDWESIISHAVLEGEELHELLGDDYKRPHLENLELIEHMVQGGSIPEVEKKRLSELLGIDPDDIATKMRQDSDAAESSDEEEADPSKPTIIATSLVGSKGLQASHVFIVGVNEEHFPHSNAAPTEDEVCQLLVALTRTKVQCHLVTTKRLGRNPLNRSLFIDWLASHTEKVSVNAAYFR